MNHRFALATTAAMAALLASSTALATGTSTPTPPASGCVSIKRGSLGNVYDSFIWDAQPSYAPGTYVETASGLSSSGGEKRALFGFDISPIPAKSIVTTAKLWVSIYSNTSQTVRAHQILDPWNENTVNWTNFGAINPLVAGSFASGGSGYKSVDISGLVQEWLNGTAPNYGVLLEEALQGSTTYKSGESGKPERFPYLEVCYTEPPKSSVGDTVFFDGNADGIQGGDEPGIHDVVVDLFADADCDGLSDGTVVATTVTDIAGSYHFMGLTSGCYVVDIDDSTLPPGHLLTTGTEQLGVSLSPGQDKTDADFGYVTFSSIGDSVWLDSDADGHYDSDAGEIGVNGVLVELYSGGALVEYTYTASSPYTGLPGFYLFDSLSPGSYTVVVDTTNFGEGGPLVGHEPTFDLDGALDNTATLPLGWAEDFLAADFGYQLSCGNGACAAGEDCSTCATDCGACPASCGDGSCNGTEDCSTCAADCGACGPMCGDEICEGSESCSTCAADCGACPPSCGDGTCNGSETCAACPSDCGLCPIVCGDHMCASSESCSTCAADCGACPPVCGDHTCSSAEDCSSCASDCGACPIGAPGTGTQGYWKNHPSAWPVQTLVIGGKLYTKAELITIMKHPTAKDVTYSLAQQLIAAKLNVAAGNNSSCIEASILAADAWLAMYPIGSNVKAGGASSPWSVGQPLNAKLDSYNNGLLCAPHRD